ncbi:5667_t:CDS:10 [Ambispora gerdemannii]|uniref:5667_t:CDS:1 n=1 Tax=Ambispora gerdemannii TaxID=144530 RepID=A0A9N8W407_9GLOM|nr:5667_t:CDS:10 [Ambispora gerdemannii]
MSTSASLPATEGEGEADDGPPRKRPRLIRALDGEQVFDDSKSMAWFDQEEETRKALFQDLPNVIVSGAYSPGESNFFKFVTSGVFVDKSLFIIEFMIYSERAILITRPRWFGKSTNLSMLYTFLQPVSEQEKGQKLELFKDLKVAKFDWFMKLHFGNWPVIYVSFKDLNYKSWDSMLSSIKERISELYKEHRYIIIDKKLYPDDESLFINTLDGTIDESCLINAISRLTRHFHEYFGKQTIILIDEYDWPMEHARNFYNEADVFFKSMYSSVAKILFVGLLPLGQASFLSGLNNVGHYPMHILPGIYGRAHFSDMFGFTEREVELLLSKSDWKFELDNLRTHYNGYQTSTNVRIYNPHSSISFMQKGIIRDYWANSGSAITIMECLKKCSQNIEDQLQNLFYSFYSLQDNNSSQRHVEVKLTPHLRYDVLEKKLDINAIYTLLCYSGYLTVNFDDKLNNGVDKQWKPIDAKLIIPNKEVAEQWRQWIIEIVGVDRLKMNDIFNSLFKKDIKKFCEQFPALFAELISFYDIGDAKRAMSYEGGYHTFVLGAIAMFYNDDYQIVSNGEAGDGRPDVRIIPINQKFDTCIIFEFKLAKSEDREEMRKFAKKGLKQIADKNYRSNTASHIETIVEVAITFCNKSTFVSAQCLQRKKGKLSTHAWEIVSSAESDAELNTRIAELERSAKEHAESARQSQTENAELKGRVANLEQEFKKRDLQFLTEECESTFQIENHNSDITSQKSTNISQSPVSIIETYSDEENSTGSIDLKQVQSAVSSESGLDNTSKQSAQNVPEKYTKDSSLVTEIVQVELAHLLYQACKATKKSIKTKREEISSWGRYSERFEDKVIELRSKDKNLKDKTARAQIYNEMRPYLTGITDEYLRKITSKARKINKLFGYDYDPVTLKKNKGIGWHMVNRVTYSADTSSRLTNLQIQYTIDQVGVTVSKTVNTVHDQTKTEVSTQAKVNVLTKSQVSESERIECGASEIKVDTSPESRQTVPFQYQNVIDTLYAPAKSQLEEEILSETQVNPLPTLQIGTTPISISKPIHDRASFRRKVLDQYPDIYYEYNDYYGITDESLCPLCKLDHDDNNGIEGRYEIGSYYIKCEQRGIEIEITA